MSILDWLKGNKISIYCKDCRRKYVLGKNALVASTIGVLGASKGYVITLDNGSSLVDNRNDPDLVKPLPSERSWSSLDPTVVHEQHDEIKRISSLLSTGTRRWWSCGICGKDHPYK